MKTKILLQSVLIACFLAISTVTFSQSYQKKGFEIILNQEKSSKLSLTYNLGRYKIDQVEKSGVVYSKITTDNKITSNKKGWAELPFMNTPIQISDSKNVSVKVVSSEFEEIQLTNPLLPSRGTITRNQNPSEIPYIIDANSIKDKWYPANLVESSSPYIVKDVRGTDIKISAFQYNSAKNILRVYKSVTVEVVENETKPVNAISKQTKIANKEMNSIYKSLFVNYKENTEKWTNEIREFGDILVIYTSRDASVIQPWITWKKQMGYKVYEQQVATGTNVKTTIKNAYTANTNIFYVQLVGDWADIKSDEGTSGNAPMDPMMGCVVGTDDHHDIVIGRFSASTTAAVTVQVNKSINYEKNPEIGGTWYTKALGIGSAEGPGDDSEIDQDHIDNIKENKLLKDNYTSVTEAYGASVATSVVSNAINSGVGLINYCGHGDHDYWVTSEYSAADAASSTNGSKLPFVFSVACIAGEFHTGSDCLAEGMLKKENGGALAVWMSTINQPWDPPMRGQDYANDILTGGFSYTSGTGTSTTYGKTTYGSITCNAAALMVGESSTTDDWETYKTWTIFGDASVQVRTLAPKTITIVNPNVTPETYTTQITVNGVEFKNALVSLYSSSSTQPFSGLTDASGNVTITHTLAGTCKLTVTGYNLATYSADHVIGTPEVPICDFSATPTTITRGQSVTFTDLSQNYPASWAWSFTGGTPATSTSSAPVITYNTVGTYAVSLTVTNSAGTDFETKTSYITVNEITNAPVTNFSASATSVVIGQSVNFTDLSTNLPNSWAWTFTGGTPSSSDVQNPTGIVYSTAGTYAVTLVSTNNIGSDTETKSAYIVVSNPAYCDAASTNTDEYISNVSFGTINNTSATGNYTDYTAKSTDVNTGSKYTLSVSLASCYATDQVLAWADWNKDGDFADASEAIFTSAEAGTSGTTTLTSEITIPISASSGSTRLRIRLHDISYGPNTDPCGDSDYGEVEDYSINILSASPSLNVSSSTLTAFTYVEGNGPSTEKTFSVSGTNLNSSDVTISTSSDYEISLTSGSAYASSKTLTAFNGTTTIVYVRLKSGLAVGTYASEIITIAGGGASSVTVSCSGQVTAHIEGACATDLFISEYHEPTTGNNKGIEIYNKTGNSVDLAGYWIGTVTNGGTDVEASLNLSGTLLDGQTVCIYNSSATDANFISKGNINITWGSATWNGDDAVYLLKGGKVAANIIDAIGTVPTVVDPGSAFINNEVSTLDIVLVRKSSVTAPTTTWSGLEWEVLAVGTTTNYGTHTMICETGTETVIEETKMSVYPNPTNGILNLRIDENDMQNATVQIFNSIGQIVYSNKFEEQININRLPKGFYMINISSENKVWNKTIIKE